MAKIEVNAFDITTYNGSRVPSEVRLYCSQTFTNSTGQVVVAGELDSPNWCKKVSVTNSGGVLTAGAFTGANAVDPTIINSYDNGATYTLALYDSTGTRLAVLYSGLRVYDSSSSPTTWGAINVISLTVYQPQRFEYPTWDQVLAYLSTSGFVHLAGTENIGGPKTFTVSPIVPTPTTASQAVPKSYVDQNYGPFISRVLRFNANLGGHVNLGAFTTPGKKYSSFYIDMLVKPTDLNQVVPGYFLSPGWGGAHTPALIGYISSGGKFNVTGNIWNNAANATVSFNTVTKFDVGQWYYIGVGWDGTNLFCVVNGVVEAVTPYSGIVMSPANTDTILYFGGSNHDKASFDGSWLRVFMNKLPVNVAGTQFSPFTNMSIFPKTAYYDGSKIYQAQGLWDFSKPGNIITDESNGLYAGISQKITNTVIAAAGITGNGNAKSVVTAAGMPNSPKTVTVPVTTALTTASAIATAFRTALAADADVASWFNVGGTGAAITLETIDPTANDPTMNFTIEHNTSTGITDALTAVQTTAGSATGELIRHAGILDSGSDNGNFQNSFPIVNLRPTAADLPQSVIDTITAPAPVTVVTVPPAAKEYDSFSNREAGPFWSDVQNIGSTEGGTNGIKPWTSTTGTYGISGGAVFPYGQGTAFTDHVMVDCGSAVQHIILSGVEGTKITVRGASVADDTFAYAQVFVSGGLLQWDVGKIVSGTPTSISSGSAAGTMPSVVEFIINGNSVTLKTDGTTRVNTTGSGVPAGTKAGFLLTTQDLAKISSFEVD